MITLLRVAAVVGFTLYPQSLGLRNYLPTSVMRLILAMLICMRVYETLETILNPFKLSFLIIPNLFLEVRDPSRSVGVAEERLAIYGANIIHTRFAKLFIKQNIYLL